MLRRSLFFSICIILSLSGSLSAQGKPATAEQLLFFEKTIRPLLSEHCYRCHGSKKDRGELRLDTRAGFLKGGASGPVVAAGHPEKSLLIKAVRQVDESLKMPPDKKLPERDIAALVRWIAMGAPYPEDRVVEKTADPKEHWAFKPITNPAPPPVKDASWTKTPLDRFILARLESKGLKPAPAADRRTLIRRATFDLTGLPPTPEEIDAFLKDDAPDAFAKVVERLLASPAYGERWGRHWLDVARYADSNGLDENVAFGTAWRYRDYVVAAFNQDKPYDQFILEQLAGDLLPDHESKASRAERLIATGFLSLGPKVLAEVDERKMEMDIVDEQIDTVGRTFLGLTLGCARCHDHKFDPLTMEDYYGLAGIFKSTRTMENFKKVARWYENPLPGADETAIKAAHEKELAKQREAIAQLVADTEKHLRDKFAATPEKLPKSLEPLYPEAAKQELKRLRSALAKLEKSGPELPTALGVTEAAVVDVPIHLRGNHLKLGKVAPRSVPQVVVGAASPSFPKDHSGRLELARWLVQPENPLTSRVMVNRLWRWHFGRGLVASTDNFGHLGEAPSHPELLDWLARRFVESGWSIKAMHRLILLSSTYQMASSAGAKSLELDPENRLFSRASLRRLEAEAIRDALLAVTGTLERTMGGSLLHVKNRAYLFDHTSRDTTNYDSRRRSLYLPVIRNNVYDVFQLFDFPDPAVPTGDRSTTTVAPQALFLMNSDWLADLCANYATKLLAAGMQDEARIRLLYLRAYGRPPSVEETQKGLRLLGDIEQALVMREADASRRRVQAWAAFCQVVLSANEFVYVK